MSEESMVATLQKALQQLGIDDQIEAVGEFNPRGHTGGLFAGGLAGGSAGSLIGGNAGDAIGVGLGSIAGMHAADDASGLPGTMLIGVSASNVYGFGAKTRSKPTDLVFKLPRDHLEVKVHQRVNVRVLELIHADSGSTVELEGNRIPLTHSKDVIDALNA